MSLSLGGYGIRANANAALFLVCDESASMSGVCLPATDGGNLARTSIIFPGDLGGAAGVLPAALGQDVAVEALSD